MEGSGRIFYLRCHNKESYEIWKTKLKHSIDRSTGSKKELNAKIYEENFNTYFNFWRFLRITEKALNYQADTGDLILCKAKEKKTKKMKPNNNIT